MYWSRYLIALPCLTLPCPLDSARDAGHGSIGINDLHTPGEADARQLAAAFPA
jgi:hypothetical protein